ncbi:MAG: dephospho-CoA kinase [Desulfotalea sp.]
MKIVVTGGFGCGKSCVTSVLSNLLYCYCLSADEICRQQLEPGAVGWCALKSSWGSEYFLEDGRIDRNAVKDRIFSDDKSKIELEDILHPLVFAEINSCAQIAEKEYKHLLVEIPLFFESKKTYTVDNVVVVSASNKIAIDRACLRDGMSKSLAQKIIASQMDIKSKCERANYVINNDGMFVSTYSQILLMISGLR